MIPKAQVAAFEASELIVLSISIDNLVNNSIN